MHASLVVKLGLTYNIETQLIHDHPSQQKLITSYSYYEGKNKYTQCRAVTISMIQFHHKNVVLEQYDFLDV
jgi:hypothetical protein